jgi:hypothetical protein
MTAGALVLAGCVALDAAQCRAINWREVGERDGLLGNQPGIETYTAQCEAHGVRPDAARYLEGWRVGYNAYEDRTRNSGTD